LNGGRFGFSYFSSREDGTVVRQFSNAYTLSNTWQLRLEGVQALGGAELQAYKASLESAVNATVRQAPRHSCNSMALHCRAMDSLMPLVNGP
jgi:hypothetical protein